MVVTVRYKENDCEGECRYECSYECMRALKLNKYNIGVVEATLAS